MGHATLERELLIGTRLADYIRASGHNGCINRPNTWLHPNASLKCPIFPLHRGRRPYMCRFSDAGMGCHPRAPATGVRKAPRQEIAGSGHWRCRGCYGDLAAGFGLMRLDRIGCRDRFSAKPV